MAVHFRILVEFELAACPCSERGRARTVTDTHELASGAAESNLMNV